MKETSKTCERLQVTKICNRQMQEGTTTLIEPQPHLTITHDRNITQMSSPRHPRSYFITNMVCCTNMVPHTIRHSLQHNDVHCCDFLRLNATDVRFYNDALQGGHGQLNDPAFVTNLYGTLSLTF
ncbi:hypothetical protein TNCV_3803001 [Trichonephila clavipes]|nr:hypothetical protein TNCV_3803001 [Trichonephila clavipes]